MRSTVAILGGEGHLGRILSEYLDQRGFTVVSLDLNPPSHVAKSGFFVECDFSIPTDISRSAQKAVGLVGEIDHCITSLRFRGESGSDYESMVTEFMVDVAGPHAWIEEIRAVQPAQVLQSVVHISSVLATSTSLKEPVSYHCAKGALEALVRWEALAWGKQGTSVNAIAPGYIDFDSANENAREGTEDLKSSLRQKILIAHALQRPATSLAICELTKFLLFSEGMTGQVLHIDSGSSILEPLGVILRSPESFEK